MAAVAEETGSRSPRASESGARRGSTTERAAQEVRDLLANGSWSAGDRLPSELKLAHELGVSRVTARAALSKLEAEGLVVRKRGSGTYVNSLRPLVSSLHINRSAENLIRSAGNTPGVAEVSWKRVPASEEVCARLGLAQGTPVIELYRVRTADGHPVTIEYDYFDASLVPDEPVSVGPSVYTFLATVCNVEVAFGIAEIEPAVLDQELADRFETAPGSLSIILRQVDYDDFERPVCYSVEQHLASAFNFQLLRQGPAGRGAHPPIA